MSRLKAILLIIILYFLDWHLLFIPNAFLNSVATHRSNDVTYYINYNILKTIPFDFESTDASGSSPLVYAVYFENEEVVDFLLSKVSCDHAYLSLQTLKRQQIKSSLDMRVTNMLMSCKYAESKKLPP